VLTPATNHHLPRLGVLLDDAFLDTPNLDEKETDYRLVKVAVLAPPETIRRAAKMAATARRLVSTLVVLMVMLSVATFLVTQLLPPLPTLPKPPTMLPNSDNDNAQNSTKNDAVKQLHSNLRWGPPTVANLTAACPYEVAACGLEENSRCPVISHRALSQQDVGVLFISPGMEPTEQALVVCYFNKYPPPWWHRPHRDIGRLSGCTTALQHDPNVAVNSTMLICTCSPARRFGRVIFQFRVWSSFSSGAAPAVAANVSQ
jgi:hypothetical protein